MQCADQTWYLAADWNMFLLAPLLVWSIWRWRHLALHILTGTTLLSTAGVFVYSYVTKAMPSMLISGSDAEHLHYTLNIYRTAHHRVAAYVIGVGLGCVFHYFGNSKLKVDLINAALSLMAFVVFGGYPLKQYEYHDRGLAAAFFGAVHRPVWALAIAWLIFACHQGFGGWLNSFLSARFWLPLSRISLCISLLNPLVLLINIGRMRSPKHLDEYELARSYIGDCGITVVISLLLYLMVEAPASRLVTLALPGRKPTTKPKIINGEKKQN
ncbi:hypothetical protein B566_EDAN004211 [Ephemera danica]|nr:hypothetical protein B566_EDAN004211 [Ephemera danica]